MLGLVHRSVGRVARTNAFEVLFRARFMIELLMLGTQKFLRICCTPMTWYNSGSRKELAHEDACMIAVVDCVHLVGSRKVEHDVSKQAIVAHNGSLLFLPHVTYFNA